MANAEPDPTAATLAHYDRSAAAFAADTGRLDLTPLYRPFLSRVPVGGRILDAGCGVGRDALAFARLGYEVVAFDASTAMVREARVRLAEAAPVLHMRFDEVAWRGEFDGLWTCASLLHVPLGEFPMIGGRFAGVLRPGGAWYLSFKLGAGERRAADGRLFVDHDEATLRHALARLPVVIAEVWESPELRRGRSGEHWLNCVAVRA